MTSVRSPRTSVREWSLRRKNLRRNMDNRSVARKKTQHRIRRSGGAQRWARLIEVKIADWLACRRVLGLLHRLFKFLRQDVFLFPFLGPGIRKLVFALAVFVGQKFFGVGLVPVWRQ